jgi:hypothetical protein
MSFIIVVVVGIVVGFIGWTIPWQWLCCWIYLSALGLINWSKQYRRGQKGEKHCYSNISK